MTGCFSPGGISPPWQVGQSGHPNPDPVARTTTPTAIRTKVEMTDAIARRWATIMQSVSSKRFAWATRPGQPTTRVPHDSTARHDLAPSVLVQIRCATRTFCGFLWARGLMVIWTRAGPSPSFAAVNAGRSSSGRSTK